MSAALGRHGPGRYPVIPGAGTGDHPRWSVPKSPPHACTAKCAFPFPPCWRCPPESRKRGAARVFWRTASSAAGQLLPLPLPLRVYSPLPEGWRMPHRLGVWGGLRDRPVPATGGSGSWT